MLDTLANLKAALLLSGTADDALLTRLMDGAAGFVAAHTGRAFDGGTFTELHPGGTDAVFLRNFPVASLTSVKVDADRAFGPETARPPDGYVLLADRGVIRAVGGPFLPPRGRDDRPGTVQVVYATAGAAPAVVKEAFAQLVMHWFRQAKTFAGQDYQMLTERVSGTDAKSWPWGLSIGFKVPPGVLQLLAPFRAPPL